MASFPQYTYYWIKKVLEQEIKFLIKKKISWAKKIFLVQEIISWARKKLLVQEKDFLSKKKIGKIKFFCIKNVNQIKINAIIQN